MIPAEASTTIRRQTSRRVRRDGSNPRLAHGERNRSSCHPGQGDQREGDVLAHRREEEHRFGRQHEDDQLPTQR